MPVLKAVRDIRTLYLPSTKNEANEDDRAWVRFDVAPRTAGELDMIERSDSSGMTSIKLVMVRIVEWNFTNEQGERLPVNPETVKLLSFDDFTWLQSQIEEGRGPLTDSEKKALEPTSDGSETQQDPNQQA